MKTIGMIGGTTWESTKEYYRIINEAVQLAKGDDHSAKIILHSVDFYEIKNYSKNNDWKSIIELFIKIGRNLSRSCY